jgi:hypothetical protein
VLSGIAGEVHQFVVIEGEVADDWEVQSLYELIGKSAAVDSGHV